MTKTPAAKPKPRSRRGRSRREDPAHKGRYEEFRRVHPLERLRNLLPPFIDAFGEFCKQSEKEFRGRSEQQELDAAVNSLIKNFHEMNRCGVNIVAACMQVEHRDQFKIL